MNTGTIGEKVVFPTEDGVFIAGDYYAGPDSRAPAVLLLHMMPADRKSWKPFALKLQKAGYQALAIDLRGHGESIKENERTIDFQRFYADTEHQASRLDVLAAAAHLQSRGAEEERLALVGASIGANLALQYLSSHPKTPAAVLLSPGISYHGIRADKAMEKLTEHQLVLLMASEEDSYSAESVRRLGKIGKAAREVKFYKDLGHGTAMFEKDPATMETVLNWIKKQLPNS